MIVDKQHYLLIQSMTYIHGGSPRSRHLAVSLWIYLLTFISLEVLFLENGFSLKRIEEVLVLDNEGKLFLKIIFPTDIHYYDDAHYKLFLCVQILDSGKN